MYVLTANAKTSEIDIAKMTKATQTFVRDEIKSSKYPNF